MLSFFRSIRRSLIGEGKTVKYLKYAVGEFLLIVAGILVALQIQTWNENRKLEQDRQELIENLKADFRESLQTVEENLQKIQDNNEGLQEFLRLAVGENEHLSIEELQLLIRNGYQPTGTIPVVHSYDSAVSSGAINLIQDRYLEEQFTEFEHGRKAYDSFIGITRIQTVSGESAQLRKELGSAALMMGDNPGFAGPGIVLEVPEAFQISDEAFRAFIARKEIYSMFENRLILRGRIGAQFQRMIAATKNILDRLEEL